MTSYWIKKHMMILNLSDQYNRMEMRHFLELKSTNLRLVHHLYTMMIHHTSTKKSMMTLIDVSGKVSNFQASEY